MAIDRIRVTSGITQLDRFLGGLLIGDNVVWYDDAGSLAYVFCLNFIQSSLAENKPVIYISYDRSPKNVLDELGEMAENDLVTILDCFTHGKGNGSSIFLKYYNDMDHQTDCRIIRVTKPHNSDQVMETIYSIHEDLEGDVRLVFDSLTGMQQLWNSEEETLRFYTRSCPRLYELNTIAYWIVEKHAHSQQLRAHINKIAQVAVDLSIKRGKSSLTVLKADKRDLDVLNRPFHYWCKGREIIFDMEKRTTSRIGLGARLKELRTRRSISQTELAKLVGVTPSTISQVESDLIYPSLPALLKMAEVLAVDVSAFFQAHAYESKPHVFPSSENVDVLFSDQPKDSIIAKRLTPVDFEAKTEPFIIEILPEKKLPSHFFMHKGEEVGYLLSGTLELKMDKANYTVNAGDLIYLVSDLPAAWRNPGPETAKLIWLKVKG